MKKAISAVSELPEETQEALASSLLEEVAYLSTSSLMPDQEAVVEDRMSRPFNLVSEADVEAVHRKYQ